MGDGDGEKKSPNSWISNIHGWKKPACRGKDFMKIFHPYIISPNIFLMEEKHWAVTSCYDKKIPNKSLGFNHPDGAGFRLMNLDLPYPSTESAISIASASKPQF